MINATISEFHATVTPFFARSATTVAAWRFWLSSAASMSSLVYGTPSFCMSASFLPPSLTSIVPSLSHV